MSSHLHFMVSGMAHAMSDVCTARAVSPPDQSPTPACKCSPRRPHRRRWSTRMCLAELHTVREKAVRELHTVGEGVARAARPIRVIDATTDEQLAGILIPGGRTSCRSRIRTDTVHKTQMRNVLLERRGDWGAHHWRQPSRSLHPGHAAPILYGTLRLAVANTTPFTVAPMLTVVTVQL